MAASDKKPVMDVSKPGKSPADATARPIITGHAMMKDPMVTEEAVAKPEETEVTPDMETADKEAVAPSAAHKVIQPLAAVPETPEPTDKPETEEADKPAEPEEPKEEQQPSVAEDAVVDAVLEQVGDKKQENKLSEEEAKRQEMIDKLVDEKKYFLPIHHERSKKNGKLALVIFAALLPVIVGLGLAADAGAIDLGFKVPFDFIKDKQAVTTTSQTPTSTQPKVTAVTLPSNQLAKFEDKTGFGLRFTYPSAWKLKMLESNPRLASKHYGLTLATSDMEISILSGQGQDIYKAGTLINEDDCKDLSFANKPLIKGTKISAVYTEQQKDSTTGILPDTKDVNTVLASTGGCAAFKSEEFLMPSIAPADAGRKLYVSADIKDSSGKTMAVSVEKLEQLDNYKYLRDIVIPSLEFLSDIK
jgi:hypothetical protein